MKILGKQKAKNELFAKLISSVTSHFSHVLLPNNNFTFDMAVLAITKCDLV